VGRGPRRQPHLEDRASVIARSDRAAVLLDDRFGDRQAKAAAPRRLTRAIGFVKAIEDQRKTFLGDAGTVVLN
jgi:hypothetical protein